MGEMREFSLALRAFLKTYPWRRIDPVPWSPLRKPLSEATVAVVSSGGMVLNGDPLFDVRAKGGDYTLRLVSGQANVHDLVDSHRSKSFDHAGIRSDPNLAFPLDRMRELAREGRIGRLAPRNLSFMGSITAPGRLVARSAPEAAEILVDDGVDAALLVPV